MTPPDTTKTATWKDHVRREWTEAAAGWRKWHAQLEVLGGAATEAIVEAAQVSPGLRVLDLASGTGEPALSLAQAVGPTGSVTATDLVPEMLAAAAEHAQQRGITNITFQQADAEALPFPDQTFDVATCRMGVMLFANVPAALGEVRRVLKPGGRIAFVVQGPEEQNPWQGCVMQAIAKYAPIPAPEPGAPHVYRFARPGTLSQALRDAGFQDVHEESRPVPWPWPGSPENYWTYRRETTTRVRNYLASVPEAARESLGREVIASLEKYYDGQRIEFPAVIVVASARR